jgi:predicted nucleic acid-binding protein
VDTSALLALVDDRDGPHAAAKRLFAAESRRGRRFVTTTYIFDEVITLARRRIGHALTVTLGEKLLHSGWCEIVDLDDGLRGVAWEIFVRHHDQKFSFTDCTSFAFMRSRDLTEAFTFDRNDFTAAGFTPVP